MKKFFFILLIATAQLSAQYITPNNGAIWNLDSLVFHSMGAVTGTFPNYNVNSLITVSAADKVTVPPGAIVTFTAVAAGFEVNGIFSAVGTNNNMITFTATTPDSLGGYQGFRFNDTSVDAECAISFARIEYAYYGLRAVGASPTFTDNVLFKCRRGVNLSSSSPMVARNYIERSYEYGITLTLGSSPQILNNTLVNNNTQNTSAKNQISIGTQGNNSPIVKYNTIYGSVYHRTGGISVSTIIGGSAGGEISYNTIYNNSFGISFFGSTATTKVHGNIIYNNTINPDPMVSGSGINVNGTSGNAPVFTRNQIFGNYWGVTVQNGTSIQAGPSPNFGNLMNADTTDDGKNEIHGNMQGAVKYDFFNNCTNDVYAQNNDWGVYDSVSIEANVHHKADSSLRGTVFFMPFSAFIPVELTLFTASVQKSGVTLQWNTATETNNLGFSVQRAVKEGEWQTLGFVNGAGTTTQPQRYSFVDPMIPTGKVQYRIVQTDMDGATTASSPITVESDAMPTEHSLAQNYPNPFNPSTTIAFTVAGSRMLPVTLEITDVTGQVVDLLIDEELNPGTYNLQWNGTAFSSGVYFSRLTVGNFTESKKIVLMK